MKNATEGQACMTTTHAGSIAENMESLRQSIEERNKRPSKGWRRHVRKQKAEQKV